MEDWRYYVAMVAAALFKVVLSKTLTIKQSAVSFALGVFSAWVFTRKLSDPGVRLYNGTCMLHCILASGITATFFNGELTVQEK